MPPRHILIVNARNVTQPVFVIGAPHSGAEAVGRALKLSPGFHVTIGQQPVLQAVYGFARRPSLYNGRGDAAAAVIRDAFAQGWQLNPTSCLECTPQCRSAAGLKPSEVGPCVEQRGLSRFGDASPDLAYSAEALVHAFPDALIVQVVRDGRDTVAAMLEDQMAMSWFRPGVVNIDTEFPNPFYGVEDESDRQAWPCLSASRQVRDALAGRDQAGRPAAPGAGRRPAEDAALRGHGPRPGRGGVRADRSSSGRRSRRRSPRPPSAPRPSRTPGAGRSPTVSWPRSRRSRARSCGGWATSEPGASQPLARRPGPFDTQILILTFLVLELRLVEVGVQAARRQQLPRGCRSRRPGRPR